MKKFVLAALLALGFTAASYQQASAWNPIRLGVNIGCVNYGFTLCFDCTSGACGGGGGGGCGGCGPCGGAGPWYSYYPYAAHFQGAAPMGYPFWPGMSSMGGYGGGGPVPCGY